MPHLEGRRRRRPPRLNLEPPSRARIEQAPLARSVELQPFQALLPVQKAGLPPRQRSGSVGHRKFLRGLTHYDGKAGKIALLA